MTGLTPLDTLETMVRETSALDGSGLSDAFVQQAVLLLEEAGELSAPEVYRPGIGRVSAVDWDDETGRLSVVVADFGPGRWGVVRDRQELIPFVNDVSNQLARILRSDPASSANDDPGRLLSYVGDVRTEIRALRVVLFSNGSVDSAASTLDSVAGLPTDLRVWDAGDLAGIVSSSSVRDRTIDFSALPDGGLPSLGPVGERGLSSHLLVLPGDVVADLYQVHGASVLGRNVRAFLQVRNKVNSGIRETLRKNPGAFFAFNNGLSLTATEVKRALVGGQSMITSLSGLEIVNGGQTTASLHHAKYHDGVDLSAVRVAAKLTILPAKNSDQVALDIARFANSQSPVRMGDLTSNSPFFQAVETLSRSVDFGRRGSPRLWFFERLRGQFTTEHAAASSLGTAARFTARFDRSRSFDKSELAKYELAWLQQPAVVSAGAERSLATFMNLQNGPASGGVPDEKYFRRLVAKAMLWRATNDEITRLDLGGYKSLDVPYVIALIAHRTAGRVDLEAIAKDQRVPDSWKESVRDIGALVHETLITSAGNRNVSSWAKTASAWESVKAIPWEPPAELVSAHMKPDPTRVVVAGGEPTIELAADQADIEGRERVIEFGGEAWFQLSSWAKETDNLRPWQRGLAFSLGRLVSAGRVPTARQVVQGVIILDTAGKLGFVPTRD